MRFGWDSGSHVLSPQVAFPPFSTGSACVLVISGSAAFSAGRQATSAPLALTCQPTNCKWTLSKLRVTVPHAQYTHGAFVHSSGSVTSHLWGGLRVLLAPPPLFSLRRCITGCCPGFNPSTLCLQTSHRHDSEGCNEGQFTLI